MAKNTAYLKLLDFKEKYEGELLEESKTDLNRGLQEDIPTRFLVSNCACIDVTKVAHLQGRVLALGRLMYGKDDSCTVTGEEFMLFAIRLLVIHAQHGNLPAGSNSTFSEGYRKMLGEVIAEFDTGKKWQKWC